MKKTTKVELLEALKEFGVLSKNELFTTLKEYGVVTELELKKQLSAYPTKSDLKMEILKSERRSAVRLTKVKNDLALRIANVAVAKEERSKVEKIDSRVTTLENFVYA